ncbi:hypothetical protein H0H87_009881 [Tephrocybe sp. NHM501043]|nr:hypothetical protein H0H87_009881 [Tephrocybe sp. NHM501043]
MSSTRTLGLGPSLRRAVFAPRILRNQVVLRNVLQKRRVQLEFEGYNQNLIKLWFETCRAVQTTSIPASKSMELLNKQRLLRPSSPHFTIYQPQLTWIASIFNRGAGVGLSVLLYGFSLAYLVAPTTFDSTHVIEAVAGFPDAVKYAGKFVLALPFAFHSFNGLRHLAWDMGKFMTVKGCYSSGYAVLGATAVSTLALVFYM